MAQVEFQYNGINTVIQCNEEQKMSEICNSLISKSNINEKEINYFYNGIGGTQFNKDLTFNQMANALDKQRKKMNILVFSIDNNDEEKKLIRAKNIICPDCGEDIKIEIENYKINLFGCKNNHEKDSIPFKDFEKTQMIDLKKIKCSICKENDKTNTYNNEFYKCGDCDINICPLCKLKHNKEHNIINYEKIHFICNKHNEPYIYYCTGCDENICTLCEEEHKDHEKELISKMMINKKDLFKNLNELKTSVNLFNKKINEIIKILNEVKDNMNNYYNFAEYIINNYEQKERNYEILYNINKIIKHNDVIINNINELNKNDDTIEHFKNIFDMYNEMNKAQIADELGEELAQSKEAKEEILIPEKKTKMEISFNKKKVVELHEQAKQELKKGNKKKAKEILYLKKKITDKIEALKKELEMIEDIEIIKKGQEELNDYFKDYAEKEEEEESGDE